MKAAMGAIAHGDVAEKTIQSTGAWSLLPTQAMLSCAIPSHHMNGHLRSMINFPAWLGKNSTSTNASGSSSSSDRTLISIWLPDVTTMACDYIEPLQKAITMPLVQKECKGVREVINFYNHYALTKEDAESINELATWPDQKAAKIETKVKSALTRALNKEHRLLPFAQEGVVEGRREPR
ncbi:hypothetical protein L596_016056 [Steinernema carpocapsae]|nr:hypothetical protein L596_016056 [Steinernema carpocapsae]